MSNSAKTLFIVALTMLFGFTASTVLAQSLPKRFTETGGASNLERNAPEPLLRDMQAALDDDSRATTGISLFHTTGDTGSETLNTDGFTVGDRLGGNNLRAALVV